jgi:hypothetical protein
MIIIKGENMTPLKFRRFIMSWLVIMGMVSMTGLIGMAWQAAERNNTVIVSQENVTEQLPAFRRIRAIRKY